MRPVVPSPAGDRVLVATADHVARGRAVLEVGAVYVGAEAGQLESHSTFARDDHHAQYADRAAPTDAGRGTGSGHSLANASHSNVCNTLKFA